MSKEQQAVQLKSAICESQSDDNGKKMEVSKKLADAKAAIMDNVVFQYYSDGDGREESAETDPLKFLMLILNEVPVMLL